MGTGRELKKTSYAIKELTKQCKSLLNDVSDIEEVKEKKYDVSDIEEVKEEIKQSKTLPKQENDKCDKKNIKKCEKENQGRVCNPLTGRCVDKNNVDYKKFLKTLKKPPKEEIKKSKTPLSSKEKKEEKKEEKTEEKKEEKKEEKTEEKKEE